MILCHYAERRILFIMMLIINMLRVVMLDVVIVTDSSKHCSLLQYGIDYGSKRIWGCHETLRSVVMLSAWRPQIFLLPLLIPYRSKLQCLLLSVTSDQV